MTLRLKKPTSAVSTITVFVVDEDKARELIGAALREARNARGLTQDQAAAILGIGRPQVANVELGNSFLGCGSLVKAIVNFGLCLDAKFFGVEP